jgi:putative peptide zinc metalloprotease protein
MSSQIIDKPRAKIQDFLESPWLGLRSDVILHPGPLDPDGQRSYILEDPVRGNNFRLGYTEGEFLYRLVTEKDPDAAVANLYATSTLRPSPEEVVTFITMLQREGLAILPKQKVIRQEAEAETLMPVPPFIQKLLQGSIFFRIPLLRPDRFLNWTLPYISWLWSPFLCWFYVLAGLTGLFRTLQEIELYFSTVSYLFTPQGGIAFFICLALLKTGHEFAHAYATKTLNPGLHIRSMGIFFIVFWPLLYTDTTDVWKVPDRRRRMWVSAAGVLFELAVAGIALLFWSILPDGIFRSLMFFLSGTSIFSSIFVNLNPFMRFDGYYLLMDWWGIDNLRPRAIAMLRYRVRRILLDWKGPEPEVHPHRRGMIIYGILAVLYRLFIAFSIAMAVYHFFFPILGLTLFAVEIWLFILRPLWMEVKSVHKSRRYIGRNSRLYMSGVGFAILLILLAAPLPRLERLPCLMLLKGTTRVEAADAGQLAMPLPPVGHKVEAGDMITRIISDPLTHEAQNTRFDLDAVRSRIEFLGSGGEEGAYRTWLMVEEKRLMAALEKIEQAIAQMEIHAPVSGQIMEVNEDLYEGAFVSAGTYLFTIATPESHELKAFVHENLAGKINTHASHFHATARFPGFEPAIQAEFREKSLFPVYHLPNPSLLDIAGGPIMSAQDARGARPRDAYFAFTFGVQNVPRIPHGTPSRIWVWSDGRSLLGQISGKIWKHITGRGLF